MRHRSPRLLAAALLGIAFNAQAHITLETRSAEAGSFYKAVFKVGHGCDGASIREIIVNIPDGVIGVKPMPKAGWMLDIEKAALATPVTSHGKTISEAPSVIRWSAGNLPDAHYDEFVLVARLPEQAGKLYWKVSQVCTQGRIDWAEVPVPGQRAGDSATPAAVLEVTAKPAAPGDHKH